MQKCSYAQDQMTHNAIASSVKINQWIVLDVVFSFAVTTCEIYLLEMCKFTPFSLISMRVRFLTPLDLYTDTALHNRLVKALLDADGVPSPSLYQTPDSQLRVTQRKKDRYAFMFFH